MYTAEMHLDMDGTLVNLYRNDDWRIDINTNRVDCFLEAPAYLPRERLREVLQTARNDGFRICINSWAPEGASEEYVREVYFAKMVWLAEHAGLDLIDAVYVLPYGTNKATVVCMDKAVLVDDNARCREEFRAAGYDASDPND